jgi:hypothetical protein
MDPLCPASEAHQSSRKTPFYRWELEAQRPPLLLSSHNPRGSGTAHEALSVHKGPQPQGWPSSGQVAHRSADLKSNLSFLGALPKEPPGHCKGVLLY